MHCCRKGLKPESPNQDDFFEIISPESHPGEARAEATLTGEWATAHFSGNGCPLFRVGSIRYRFTVREFSLVRRQTYRTPTAVRAPRTACAEVPSSPRCEVAKSGFALLPVEPGRSPEEAQLWTGLARVCAVEPGPSNPW